MGLNWSRRAARDIITATDLNNDGQVSMDELWRWLKLIEVNIFVWCVCVCMQKCWWRSCGEGRPSCMLMPACVHIHILTHTYTHCRVIKIIALHTATLQCRCLNGALQRALVQQVHHTKICYYCGPEEGASISEVLFLVPWMSFQCAYFLIWLGMSQSESLGRLSLSLFLTRNVMYP
jgi:hypothetical protein